MGRVDVTGPALLHRAEIAGASPKDIGSPVHTLALTTGERRARASAVTS